MDNVVLEVPHFSISFSFACDAPKFSNEWLDNICLILSFCKSIYTLCPIHTTGSTSHGYRFSEVAEPSPKTPHIFKVWLSIHTIGGIFLVISVWQNAPVMDV